MKARREALGGYLPARRKESESLPIPELSVFDAVLKGSNGKEQSTTMVMVRLISALLKKAIKDRVVPVFRMKHVPLVWKGCSVNWGSMQRMVNNIPLKIRNS